MPYYCNCVAANEAAGVFVSYRNRGPDDTRGYQVVEIVQDGRCAFCGYYSFFSKHHPDSAVSKTWPNKGTPITGKSFAKLLSQERHVYARFRR